MFEDNDQQWLVHVEDADGARWLPLPVPRPRERIEICCSRCGAPITGSIFQAVRDGHFDHDCRKPKRPGSLRIW
jgi:hypothetical protein